MLDRLLMHLSRDIEDGLWVEKGIPKGEVTTEEHLTIIRGLIYDHYMPQVNIFEYFMMDIPEVKGLIIECD